MLPRDPQNYQISKMSKSSKLLLEAPSLHVAGERLSAGDMRDTAGIISHRTKLVSSIRPASLGAPKLFGQGLASTVRTVLEQFG